MTWESFDLDEENEDFVCFDGAELETLSSRFLFEFSTSKTSGEKTWVVDIEWDIAVFSRWEDALVAEEIFRPTSKDDVGQEEKEAEAAVVFSAEAWANIHSACKQVQNKYQGVVVRPYS